MKPLELAEFLKKNNVDQGVLYVDKFSTTEIQYKITCDHPEFAISIEYDLQTGNAFALSQKRNTPIMNYFPTSLSAPIVKAIHLLAKNELLLELDKLGDKKISQLIPDTLRNGKLLDEDSLMRILNGIKKSCRQGQQFFYAIFYRNKLSKPQNKIHQAVFAALTPMKLIDVKCKRDVDEIMKLIEKKIVEHHFSLSLPKS